VHDRTFWADLAGLSGATLRTLGRGNAFDIIRIDDRGAVVRPHKSMTDRVIARSSFEGALEAICARGSLDLKGVRAFNEMNPVYVAAMIAQLPYISFSAKPGIILRYSGRH
jgi:hypothetical protein